MSLWSSLLTRHPKACAVAARLALQDSHGRGEEAPTPYPQPQGELEHGIDLRGWMQPELCHWCLCCPYLPQPTWVQPSKSNLAVAGLVPLCALTGAWQRK